MTTRRWSPDPQMIMAARAGGIRGAGLGPCDRAWAVALLMDHEPGMTGAEAAEMLRCSLRLVRLIRADPLYPLAAHAADLTRQLTDTETAARRQLHDMARQQATMQQDIVRLSAQRDRLIDDLGVARATGNYYKGRPTA